MWQLYQIYVAELRHSGFVKLQAFLAVVLVFMLVMNIRNILVLESSKNISKVLEHLRITKAFGIAACAQGFLFTLSYLYCFRQEGGWNTSQIIYAMIEAWLPSYLGICCFSFAYTQCFVGLSFTCAMVLNLKNVSTVDLRNLNEMLG